MTKEEKMKIILSLTMVCCLFFISTTMVFAELPPQVAFDMNMKHLASYLKKNDYEAAAKIFPVTDKLLSKGNLTTGDSYYYYRAETMLRTEQIDDAQKSIEKYIELTETTGKFYDKSLTILFQIQKYKENAFAEQNNKSKEIITKPLTKYCQDLSITINKIKRKKAIYTKFGHDRIKCLNRNGWDHGNASEKRRYAAMDACDYKYGKKKEFKLMNGYLDLEKLLWPQFDRRYNLNGKSKSREKYFKILAERTNKELNSKNLKSFKGSYKSCINVN